MQTLRACEIYRDARFAVFGIESVASLRGKSGAVYHLYGKVEPLAVVVCVAGAIMALDMDGEPITLEPLRETVPGLNTLLDSCADPDR